MTSGKSQRTRMSSDSGGARLAGHLHRPAAADGVLAHRAPRGQLHRYPETHPDLYRDPVRQQVVADQVASLREHLAADQARHGAASTATGHDRP